MQSQTLTDLNKTEVIELMVVVSSATGSEASLGVPARKELKGKTSKAKTGTGAPPRSLGAAPGKTKKGKPAANLGQSRLHSENLRRCYSHSCRNGVACSA